MPSIKNLSIKSIFLLVVFFIFGYLFNYLINSEINEEEITNYLENHPEEIESFVSLAEEILIDKRNEIQKNIIDQNKLFLENQKFYIGNPNGTKIVYEFFDYNCGFCKRVFSDLMELVSEDKDIKIVFIELPVLGQSSLLASKAAYESFNEGKYFEMHQKLINHRGKITIDNIKAFASEINIEPNLLIENMNKLDVGFIEENYILADKLDINGTPTFIINKNVIPGAIDKASILRLLYSKWNIWLSQRVDAISNKRLDIVMIRKNNNV